ncbi:unnamed protein product [Ixodes persulcatus]
MLLSGKYLLVILVSAIVLHHVAGIPVAKMSKAKDIETSKDSVDYAKKTGHGIDYAKKMALSSRGYISKAMDYAKKMAASSRGGSSENTTGV